MLKPSRLSSLICSTSFPLNKGRPSSVSRFGRFITSGGGNFFNRHYGYFCTGTDTCAGSGPWSRNPVRKPHRPSLGHEETLKYETGIPTDSNAGEDDEDPVGLPVT